MASANGQFEAIEILFEYALNNKKKIEINKQNSGGNTPIHWAVLNNQ